jgi:hypothetical protein
LYAINYIHRQSNLWIKLILLLSVTLACLSSNAQSLNDADSAYVEGDYKSAFTILSVLAERGDPAAQSNLSILYRDGLGVKADQAMAFRWSQAAANQGDPGAQYDIGDAFLEGKHVSKSLDRAIEWYKKSAEQGFSTAAYRLASIFYDGAQIPQDIRRAYYWMLVAASLGYSESDKYSDELGKSVNESEQPAIMQSAAMTSKAIKSIGSKIGENCKIIQSNLSITPRIIETLRFLSLIRMKATLWGSDDHNGNSFTIRIGPFPDSYLAQQAQSNLELRGFRDLTVYCDGAKRLMDEVPIAIQAESTPFKKIQSLPVYPIQRGTQACPIGYTASNLYCMPGSNARYAIARSNGNCPQGYTASGGYCLADQNTTRMAIPGVGNCPNGYNMSGGFCLSID